MAVRNLSGRSELFLPCPVVSSSSFTCGLAGAIASNPVDVVRTRMMNQRAIVGCTELYKGTLDGLVKVRRREMGHILPSGARGTAMSSLLLQRQGCVSSRVSHRQRKASGCFPEVIISSSSPQPSGTNLC